MSDVQKRDVVILGGGPGGYVAAIRAAQLGRKVTVVERADLGGICLNWGCIPTKALLASADTLSRIRHAEEFGVKVGEVSVDYGAVVKRSRTVSRKLSSGVGYLMKKNGVEVIVGEGRLVGGTRLRVKPQGGEDVTLEGNALILATGGRTRELPGVAVDGKRILSSREALVLQEVPASIAVIGSGAIGVEFASYFAVFGAEVTVFEMADSLVPACDEALGQELARAFKKRRIRTHTGASVTSVEVQEEGVIVHFRQGESEGSVTVEKVLLAVGVRPNVEGLGLEEHGVALSRKGIVVDSHYRTSVPGVYAIGDVIGEPCLAHVASAEGILAVEHLCGVGERTLDYGNIPACIYCQPQIASVGLTEKQAVAAGLAVKIGRFPLSANGKALAMGEATGFVKIVMDAGSKAILGAHLIGAEATELVGELVVARSKGVSVEDVLHAVHPHPTLSESVMEAAGDALGEAINI